MSDRHFDVVIVGAGTGGLFLAWLLGQKGVRVALVDRGSGPRWIGRGEIIQPNALALLQDHGLLSELTGLDPFRVERFVFSRTDRTPLCTVRYALLPLPYRYGLIVLPHLLHEILHKKILPFAHVRLLSATSFEGIARDRDTLHVRICRQGAEKTLICRILIGADGGRSSVREAIGLKARMHVYRDGYLTGVIPRPTGFDSDGRYFVGFGQILGLFPVSSRELYFFYMTNPREVERFRREGIASLKKMWVRIDPSLEGSLNSLKDFDPLAYRPCIRVRVNRWVADHGVIIGDAAHAMNPHVAQGSNQALEDAGRLSQVLFQAFERGRFEAESLAPFEAERRPSVERLQRLGDELTLLWNSGWPPLVWARDRIFRVMDRDGDLQHRILAQIAGLGEDSLTLSDRLRALVGWPSRANRGA